jgi:hypothetical protein
MQRRIGESGGDVISRRRRRVSSSGSIAIIADERASGPDL